MCNLADMDYTQMLEARLDSAAMCLDQEYLQVEVG